MGKASKSIPNFKSESEERAFWEGRDSTAFVDYSKARRVDLHNLRSAIQSPANIRRQEKQRG
jgi:hypothetical protein